MASQKPSQVVGLSAGDLIVLAAASCVMLYAALGKILDGRTETTDIAGRTHVVSGGSVGSYAAYLALSAGVAIALFAVGRPTMLQARIGSFFSFSMLSFLSIWALATGLRGEGWAAFALGPALALVLMMGVVADPPTLAVLPKLNTLRDLSVAASLAFSALVPSLGQDACREDKCGIFGSLWTGLFDNENSASSQMLLLAPAMVLGSRKRTVLSTVLLVTLVLATGSRTSLAALIVAVVVLVWVRSKSNADHALVPGATSQLRLLAAVPAVLMIVSGMVYLTTHARGLTGRGYVYDFIRTNIDTQLARALGAGPGSMAGASGGFVIGEHGFYPYLIVHTGLLGVLIMFLGLASLPLLRAWDLRRATGLAVLIACSARFVTEPGLMVQPRTMELAALLLIAGLFMPLRRTPPAGGGTVGALQDLDHHVGATAAETAK